MRARKIDVVKAQVSGYCHHTESPRLSAIQLLKGGMSTRDVAKKLEMSLLDVLELAERLA